MTSTVHASLSPTTAPTSEDAATVAARVLHEMAARSGMPAEYIIRPAAALTRVERRRARLVRSLYVLHLRKKHRMSFYEISVALGLEHTSINNVGVLVRRASDQAADVLFTARFIDLFTAEAP